jgi:bifunctional polynucleotide phosphatase/kinase
MFKIAAFDLDGILNVALLGKALPDYEEDWPICSPKVIRSIKKLSDNDYKIVIFTNQEDIGGNKENEKTFKKKIENIPKLIKTPVQVFIAIQKDIYRRPAPGMWNILVSDVQLLFFI